MAKRKQDMNNTLQGLANLNLSEPESNPNDKDTKIRELQDRIRELEAQQFSKQDIEAFIDAEAQNNIVQVDNQHWRFRRFDLTPTRVNAPTDLTELEMDHLGEMLSSLGSATQFWIGDWANLYVGDEKDDRLRGALYNKLADEFGFNLKTLQNYASVCRNLDVSLRRETLNFSIHRIVAECHESLKGREKEFLDWAEQHRPSTREFDKYLASQLVASKAAQPMIVEDLFAKSRIPKINTKLQQDFAKARNGDIKARTRVLGKITEFRKWLDELEGDLDE